MLLLSSMIPFYFSSMFKKQEGIIFTAHSSFVESSKSVSEVPVSVGVRGRFSVAGDDAVLWKTFPFREEAEQLHYKYTKDMQPSGTVVFGISLILCLTGVGISMHMANVK